MKYHLFFFHKYNIHLYLLTTFFISITTNLCIRIESCNLRITLIFDSNCFLLYLHFFQPSLRPPLSLYYFSLSLSPVLNFFLFLIPRDNKSSRVAGRIGSFRLRRDDDDDGNYDDVVVDDARNGMSLFLPRSFFLWAALILRYEPVGGRLRARALVFAVRPRRWRESMPPPSFISRKSRFFRERESEFASVFFLSLDVTFFYICRNVVRVRDGLSLCCRKCIELFM